MNTLRWLFMCTRRNYWRKAIGIVSVASAVCLLTWTIGVAVTTLNQLEPVVSDNTDGFNCWVIPKVEQIGPRAGMGAGFQESPGEGKKPLGISPAVVDAVRKSKLFKRVEVLSTTMVQIDFMPNGKMISGPRPRAVLSDSIPHDGHFSEDRIVGRMPSDNSSEFEVVISSSVFFRNPPQIGETLALLTRNTRVNVKIVGFFNQERTVQGFPTMFANKTLLKRLSGTRGALTTLILCEAIEGIGRDELLSELEQDGLAEELIQVNDVNSVVSSMRDNTWMQFASSLPLKVGLALAFMFCMIFTTLYTGIQQRRHMYSRMRGIGMSRGQLSATIAFEAISMGILGAVIGIIAGWLALWWFVSASKQAFPYGLSLSLSWLITIFTIAIMSTLIAAAWPCFKVFRMRPRDFTEGGRDPFAPLPWKLIITGLILILPAIALTLPLPIRPTTRCFLLGYVAVPLLGLGVLLSSTLWISLIDKLPTTIVAKFLRLDPRLLRHHIMRDLGRTIGVMVTIAVGLGLFIAIEIWGASMLDPFKPDKSLPDIVLTCLPQGIDESTLGKISHVDGVEPGTFMPLVVDQFVLSDDVIVKLESNVQYDLWQNNVIMIGIEPELAFGYKPLLPFSFVNGAMDSAKQELLQDGSCLIVRTFASHAGLQIGDTIGIRVPDSSPQNPKDGKISEHVEELRIAGVVDLNWHLYTSRAEMRGRNGKPHRTLGPIFVSSNQASKMSPSAGRTYYAWFNLSESFRTLPRREAISRMKTEVNQFLSVPGMEIQVRHRDQITADTIDHARDIIGALSSVPLWSLVIFSLSMLNLLVAIVVERRKELGMMRAVGMTRGQFVRQLSGEVILVWGAGVLFSIVFGASAGWAFTGWTRALLPFGGIPLEFDVPWGGIMLSIGFSLAACCIVAAIPIAWITRFKPCEMIRND